MKPRDISSRSGTITLVEKNPENQFIKPLELIKSVSLGSGSHGSVNEYILSSKGITVKYAVKHFTNSINQRNFDFQHEKSIIEHLTNENNCLCSVTASSPEKVFMLILFVEYITNRHLKVHTATTHH